MIRTIASIQAEARAALEAFDRDGTMPVNPYPLESELGKCWAAEFYRYGTEMALSE